MIKEILTKFEEGKIEYCVLRNYQNLEKNKDIDLLISWKDKKKIKKIMKKFGLRKGAEYGYYLSFKNGNIIFDFKVGCLAYDGFNYKKAGEILAYKRKYSYFFIIGKKDELIHLILHSIIDKNYFKPEYIRRIEILFSKNEEEIKKELEEKFGLLGRRLFLLIKNKQYDRVLKLRNKLMLKSFSFYGFYNFLIRFGVKILR